MQVKIQVNATVFLADSGLTGWFQLQISFNNIVWHMKQTSSLLSGNEPK